MTPTNPALALLASLVLEDDRRWGDAAVPEQWEDARAILDPNTETPYHFLTRARGYSKSTDLSAIAVAAMLTQLPAASRLYGLAADLDQGRLLVDSVAGFAARTPEIAGVLTVDQYKVASSRGGSVLEILPADAASAYGLRPALLIVDELAQWSNATNSRKLWEATTSAMAKTVGSRLVCLTSAGDPAHWSHRILEHAYADPLWRVNEVAGPPPWADPGRLAEQRRRLPESVYLRLFENVWTSAEDRLTTLEDLRACATLPGPLDSRPGIAYVIGVDLGLKKDRTAVAICHAERQDTGVRVVLDRMEVWQGRRLRPVRLGDVEEWLTANSAAYNHARVVIDPYQAVGMAQRLRVGGMRVEEFTFSQTSVGKLAASLHTTIRDHRLAIPDDPELIDELANVRLRETSPGVLRMDHDSDKHDDRAIALALASFSFVESGVGQGAAFLEIWQKELGASTPETKMRAEHPEIAHLPKLDVVDDRPIASERCRGDGASLGKHRWQHEGSGVQCVFCGGWRE